MPNADRVLVWDPLVRLCHWGLGAAFVTAYAVEDDRLALHTQAGYLALGLVAFRLVWGFVGPRHARWADFLRRPTVVAGYLADIARFRAHRYLGHNPAGGAMVVALLLGVAGTTLSGLALYGTQELSGPLAPWLMWTPPAWGHVLEKVHETLADLTAFLVVLHLLGVALASLQHRENLVKSLFTGYKRSP
jgi:cytochrome b